MKQKPRSDYAIRLDKDPIARRTIAVMRLCNFSYDKIAELTGRHKRTIIKEFNREEHLDLYNRFLSHIGKNHLPDNAWAVIEKELAKKGVAKPV